MSNAHIPILVGVASPVLEIKLAFKLGQSFLSDYAHGSQKIETAQNIHASRG